MGTVDIPIPRLGDQGEGQAQDQIDCLDGLVTEVNGLLDNDNLAPRSMGRDLPLGDGWVEQSVSPEMKLVSGNPIPGTPEEYLYGTQTVEPGTFSAFPPGVLRELSVAIEYSKAPRDNGTNHPDLALNCAVFAPNPLGSLLSASLPGSDGLRSHHTTFLQPGGITLLSDRGGTLLLGFDNWGNFAGEGQPLRMLMFATGTEFGPLDGWFTIHKICFRYRDWEFT